MQPNESTTLPATNGSAATPTRKPTFSETTRAAAIKVLTGIVAPEKLQEAAGRIGIALASLARANAKVELCTPASVANCIAMSALTELMPGGPQPGCWMIPRAKRFKTGQTDERGKDIWSEVQELNWQISVTGLQRLANRTGHAVPAVVVYADDMIQVGTDAGRPVYGPVIGEDGYLNFDIGGVEPPVIRRHVDADHDIGRAIGVIVIGRRLADASGPARNVGWEWVDRKMIEKRQGMSQGGEIWTKWPEEMWRKTGVRYLLSRGVVPLDDVGQRAFEADTASIIDTTAEVVQAPRGAPAPRQIAESLGLEESGAPSPEEQAEIARREREEAGAK